MQEPQTWSFPAREVNGMPHNGQRGEDMGVISEEHSAHR